MHGTTGGGGWWASAPRCLLTSGVEKRKVLRIATLLDFQPSHSQSKAFLVEFILADSQRK